MDNFFTHIQWVFSGIGVVIITGLIGWKKKKNKKQSQIDSQNIKIQKGDNNIQSEGNVNITNTTTNNIYKSEDVKKKVSPIDEIANKFYRIFEDHGVSRGQIPTFINEKFNIQYIDVKDSESIAPKINDDLLDWVSNMFGIKRSWFDATDEDYWNNKLYDSINFYKNHWAFLRLLENLIDEFNLYQYKDYIKVYFYKNFQEFKGDNTKDYGRVLVVVEILIGKTTTGPIYKYILVKDNLRWDYRKSREDLKRMIRIVERLGILNDGFDLSETEFEEISSEKIVPRNIVRKFRMVSWYPYDYDGSFNDRISKLEVEKNEEFKLSLKEINKEVLEVLERKKQEFLKSQSNNY